MDSLKLILKMSKDEISLPQDCHSSRYGNTFMSRKMRSPKAIFQFEEHIVKNFYFQWKTDVKI